MPTSRPVLTLLLVAALAAGPASGPTGDGPDPTAPAGRTAPPEPTAPARPATDEAVPTTAPPIGTPPTGGPPTGEPPSGPAAPSTPAPTSSPALPAPAPSAPAPTAPDPTAPDPTAPDPSGPDPTAPPTGLPPAPGPAAPSTSPPVPTAPPGAGVPAPGAGYAWPLLPVPEVRTLFRAPEHAYGTGHRGVDLAGAPGQAVLAARAGTVVFAGSVAGRPVVSVQHDDGLRTTYEPVLPVVAAGDVVAAGAVLGTLAADHPGCGTCLHWGVRRDRTVYLDPLVLLRPPHVRLLPVPDPWPAR